MKQKHLNRLCAGAFITLLAGGFSSCMEKDLYDPEYGKNQLLPKEEYFNFELVGDVKLSVDYKAAGYNNVFFMVFSENPVVTPGKLTLKEGIQPIYSAFTGKDGKYEGVMPIPTAVKEMWIYTNLFGVSGCAKMNFANGIATYDAAANAISTRGATSNSQLTTWFNSLAMPYDITRMLGTMKSPINGAEYPEDRDMRYGNFINQAGVSTMYSICKWNAHGEIATVNEEVTVESTLDTSLGKAAIEGISKRTLAFLKDYELGQGAEQRGGLLIKNPGAVNIVTSEENTNLQVTFLDEAAEYKNVFGYYYYPKSDARLYEESVNQDDKYSRLKALTKYIVFPNTSKEGALVPGTTVQLKYFDGKNPNGTNDFPKDYVVGWFIISQGFYDAVPTNTAQYTIANANVNGQNNQWGALYTSNDTKSSNGTDFRRFISLYDRESKSVVVGVEDIQVDKATKDSYDYCDLTFIVSSNKSLEDENKPSIPDKPKEPEIWTAKGTLAFEDMWPKGGDYDLNDVVVEYERVITYSEDNVAISAEEKFTFKQDVKAADNDDYFAYVAKLGTASVTADFTVETVTNSLIINKSAKEVVAGSGSKTFTVTRTFAGSGVTKDQVIADFDPYIIIGDRGQNRKEVHLPLHSPTSKCDVSNVGMWQDAYYIDFATGLYPFAINIPTTNFVQVTERKRIDAEGEYPNFKAWAESNGSTNTEWYNTGKGNK